jgi:hypothetical protein
MSVTVVVGKRHLLAGLFLLVLGALVAVGLSTPSSSEAVTTTYTRSASCAGLDFYPTDSRTEYDNDGALRVWRSDNANQQGTGVFRCDPGLPTGAVVKKVQFTALLDNGSGMGDCALRRAGLMPATAATVQDLGRVTFGGGPGTVFRLTDSSIDNPTIDSANWGYWLECSFNLVWPWDLTAASGLYGANVIYTITAAKG